VSDRHLRELERAVVADPSDENAKLRLAAAKRRITRRVVLPLLLSHQVDIARDDHRFKVICAGRRFGKTLFGLVAVVDGHGPIEGGAPKFRGAAHGARIWWVAPTFAIASKIWRDLKAALSNWGGQLEKDEVGRRIEFPGGGSITVKSAHDPEGLRGDGLDGIVIDEAAFCHVDTWTLTLRPTLADREGWAILISTPKGMNWFYEEWKLEKTDPTYKSWQRPTSDNPTISAAELERMKAKMGAYAWARECLAQFEVSAGGMFRREWFKSFTLEDELVVPEIGVAVRRSSLVVFTTADLAFATKSWADYTVVSTWGLAPDGRLFLLDVFRGKFETPQLVPLLTRITARERSTSLWLEAAGPLVRVNAEAREAMLPVREVEVHKDKTTRATPAAAAVENGRIFLLRDALWRKDVEDELCAFPDPSCHDDIVDTFSLAVHAAPPVLAPEEPVRRERTRAFDPMFGPQDDDEIDGAGGGYWNGSRRD